MICPVQGRHTHETRKIAEEHLSALLNNNTEDLRDTALIEEDK
jgi:hypothetical protein